MTTQSAAIPLTPGRTARALIRVGAGASIIGAVAALGFLLSSFLSVDDGSPSTCRDDGEGFPVDITRAATPAFSLPATCQDATTGEVREVVPPPGAKAGPTSR